MRQAATALFWVQPLLWALSKRLEETAEEVCDDHVVAFGADRGRYAGLLLELAQRQLPPLAPAGVGMISLRSMLARRIARILDSTRNLSTRAGARTIAATLIAGLAGTMLVGLVGVGLDHPAALAEGPGSETSAAAGRAVPEPSQEPVPSKAATVAKAAPTSPQKPAGVPITGRIVDLEGRPVAGVAVQVTQITKPKGENLDRWIEAVKRGEPPWTAYDQLVYEPPIKPEEKRPQATTDAHGRFRLDGLGGERVVHITIQGPTIGYNSLNVVTRRMEPIPAKGFPSNYGSEGDRVFGADFTYTAAPGRPVEGIVRDAKTGQPLAGANVRSEHFAGAVMHGIRDLKTTTDGQGRFRLVGFPKGRGNKVLVAPNDDQPYFLKDYEVPDPPGIAPVPVEIGLDKGIWIEGKVTDQETGKPVPGAWLHYLPFLENTFAQATSVFDKHGNTNGVTYQDRYQTKADGTYRLVGLPGRAIVGVVSHSDKPYLQGAGSESIKGKNEHGHFPTYRNPVNPGKYWPTVMKEINPAEGTKVIPVDLALLAGAKVRVRVVDPHGKPVTELKVGGRTSRGRHEWNVKHGAEFEVVTLAPEEDRMVLVIQEERKLGKIVHVKPGDDTKGPVTVALEPLATIAGRVLDADGNPVSGATIRTDPQPGGDFSLSLAGWLTSDATGKFVRSDVPTGCKYSLVVESGMAAKDRRVAFKDATVRAGETTDLGEIRFKND